MAVQAPESEKSAPPPFGLGDLRWKLRVYVDDVLRFEQGGFYTMGNAFRRSVVIVTAGDIARESPQTVRVEVIRDAPAQTIGGDMDG